MPKVAHELSAMAVSRLREPGMHAVGGAPGLHLVVGKSGSRSWIARISVNGKRRDEITIPLDLGAADIEALVLKLDSVVRALDGRAPKKVIVVPGRIVNIVG